MDRQAEEVALFEIGHVFAPPQPPKVTPDETERVAVIVAPTGVADGSINGGGSAAAAAAVQTWRYLADALRLREPTMMASRAPGLHRTRAALLTGADGQHLGTVGEVDPEVAEAYGLRMRLGYLTLSVDALLAEPRRPWQAHEVSRFPASDIDLAFAVPDAVPAAAVQRTLATAGGGLLERVWLFDVYRSQQLGPGRRSLAFRLRFRAPDRTLDEANLATLRQQAIDAVVATHEATLRS